MYTYNLSWKNFNVDLDAVSVWLSNNAGLSYCGISANSSFQIHFNEEPSQQIKNDIEDYWDAIDSNSQEALSYVSQQDILEEIDTIKIDALSKTYDQLSAAQKKLLMGLTPTRSDLGL